MRSHAPEQPIAAMRPQSLTPLFAQVTSLPGIGPRLGKLVERLAGPLVVDLLWHLPFGVIDRRNAPEVAKAQPGTVATLTVTVDEHIVPRNPRAALSRLVQRRDRQALPHLLQRPRGLSQEAAADRRAPRHQRQGRALPGRRADDASRPRRAGRGARIDPARRAGLRPDRRPDAAAACRRRSPPPSSARPSCRNGRTRPTSRSRNGRAGSRRSRRRMRRPTKPTSRRCIRRARGSPSTSCWRASSRSPWCAITIARCAGRATKGDERLQKRALAALPFKLTPSQIFAIGGDRGRHGQARAHGAAAAGRCRQRQDAGRLPRHADRGRGRRAGGADGADRAAGAPALRHHRAARRGGRRDASPC